LVDKLRDQDKIKPSVVKEYLRAEFTKTLNSAGSNKLNYKENELNIYFISGVNGVGKTTLIGKLAYRFKQEGKKVLIAAGDTFRAAAEEQLDIWSKRAGADIVRRDKADPASVVYESIQKAKSESYDVVLVDTAGRLQNKYNLMEELSKIKMVIDKQAPESLRECILVLDANTGQNGLQQAKVFKESINLTSVALTKLDGSAKGAIILAIAKEMCLPVKLIGVGEQMTDLKEFNSEEFIEALFE
jgi:fused signal recognition particle receptor